MVDKPVRRQELHADQGRQDSENKDQFADRKFVKKEMLRQDTQSDKRYVEQEGRSDDQDETSNIRYRELQAKYKRQRLVSALVILVVMVGTSFVVKFSKDARDTANGSAQATCVLVALAEATAQTDADLISAVHKNRKPLTESQRDTIRVRRESRDQATKFAADLRATVDCPPAPIP